MKSFPTLIRANTLTLFHCIHHIDIKTFTQVDVQTQIQIEKQTQRPTEKQTQRQIGRTFLVLRVCQFRIRCCLRKREREREGGGDLVAENGK